ncbi:hypothetical protein SteCoe_34548 [Stentor coeruleus]|uniref:Uncharacterized protein n=1 Tax=Stentor coeruleus TaxID=5963 RepID=A0A1R2AUB7_9CILI|nr:hypothetical protein SteCoe_34548 [Stentor coeruleus]
MFRIRNIIQVHRRGFFARLKEGFQKQESAEDTIRKVNEVEPKGLVHQILNPQLISNKGFFSLWILGAGLVIIFGRKEKPEEIYIKTKDDGQVEVKTVVHEHPVFKLRDPKS